MVRFPVSIRVCLLLCFIAVLLLAPSAVTPRVAAAPVAQVGGDCAPVTITPNATIPDANAAFTCFNMVVPQVGVVVAGSTITVAMTHPYLGDLRFQLRTPANTAQLTMLNNAGLPAGGGLESSDLLAAHPILFSDTGTGGSAETMGNTLTNTQVVCRDDGRCSYVPAPDGFVGSLPNFAGFAAQPSTGTWQFCAADTAGSDIGTLASVTLDLACTPVLGVELATFVATPARDHLRVTWETVSERDTLGFHLLRATAPDLATATRINSALIPVAAGGSGQGAAYAYADAAVAPGTTYFYWLEALDTQGSATQHGPVSATIEASSAVTLGTLRSRAVGGEGALLGLYGGALLLGSVAVLAWRRR